MDQSIGYFLFVHDTTSFVSFIVGEMGPMLKSFPILTRAIPAINFIAYSAPAFIVFRIIGLGGILWKL